MFPIRNIAILAHVDAGKTTLSERILFSAGEVRLPGDVEDGLATMDYLPEERKRGITIESGVAHFEWRKLWFNFIDTPGHVDFGAEVYMALSAVDGAVLVISAVDGVETQTLSAWKKLRSKGIRTLIFINKLDNPNCALDDTLIAIEEHLGVRPVLLSSPEFSEANSSVSQIQSELDVISGMRLVLENGKEEPQKLSANDVAQTRLNEMTKEAVEAASEYDDEILELALNGETVPPKMLLRGLSALAAADKYVLCYAGSAKQNLGVRSLMTGLSFFLPPPPKFPKKYLGEVVRLRHFSDLGEIAIFRSMAKLSHDQIPAGFAFYRLKASTLFPVEEIFPGDIYALRSQNRLALGELLTLKGNAVKREIENAEYNSLLQTRLECLRESDYHQVAESLDLLARMDPSIRIISRPEAGYWLLYTVGEVQLEVVLERLKREFGCEVHAGSPEVLWQERLTQELKPVENSFQAGPFKVSLELAAKPLPESEKDIRLSGEFLENAPHEILAGIRSALLESAQNGILGKGSLVGVEFELVRFDSECKTPIPMIKKACSDAVAKLIRPSDVVLYEPFMELSLECPAEYAGMLSGDILAREGKIVGVNGDGVMHSFVAELPLRKLFGYATAVRSGCKGRAQYSLKLLDYRKVRN